MLSSCLSPSTLSQNYRHPIQALRWKVSTSPRNLCEPFVPTTGFEYVRQNKMTGQRAKRERKRIPVVLLKEIENVGQKGEEILVHKGWARHNLFPQQMAVHSTPRTLEQYSEERIAIDWEERKKNRELKLFGKRLHKLTVQIPRCVNDKGKLLFPVDSFILSQKLHKQHGLELLPEKFKLSTPLTLPGSYKVPLLLYDTPRTDEALELDVKIVGLKNEHPKQNKCKKKKRRAKPWNLPQE